MFRLRSLSAAFGKRAVKAQDMVPFRPGRETKHCAALRSRAVRRERSTALRSSVLASQLTQLLPFTCNGRLQCPSLEPTLTVAGKWCCS